MGYALRMPQQVYCGNDAHEKLVSYAAGFRKACVLTDSAVKQTAGAEKMLNALSRAGIAYEVLDGLQPEPTADGAQAAIDDFRRTEADLLIAIGGGSVMDIAKLASIAATDACGVRELLDTPSCGRKTVQAVMIPTTAGTGAEATPNSIVAVPEKQVKVGIVNEEMIPDLVLLDGSMLAGIPAAIAASTGIDALCHALECYISRKATPFSHLFAMEALKLIFEHLEELCRQPDNVRAQSAMLRAAFYGGVAISASGTTAVHALSYPLGGRYHMPHGVANAIMLLPVMRFNAPACQPAFAEIAQATGISHTGTDREKAACLLERLEQLLANVGIPTSLRGYGITPADLDDLVEAGMGVQRLLQNNPRPVTTGDAKALYTAVL